MTVVVPDMSPKLTVHVVKFIKCKEQTLRYKDLVQVIAWTLYNEMSHNWQQQIGLCSFQTPEKRVYKLWTQFQ